MTNDAPGHVPLSSLRGNGDSQAPAVPASESNSGSPLGAYLDNHLKAHLEDLYDSLWADCDQALRKGTYNTVPVPQHGDHRWGISVVARVGGDVLANLTDELMGINAALSSAHLMFSPNQLHTTVRSLEGFQDFVPEVQVRHYVDQVCRQLVDLVADLGPLAIDYRGLGGSLNGVFACGYPSRSLMELRERLHIDQQSTGSLGVRGIDEARIRDMAHAALVVFQAPHAVNAELADYVARRRETSYGVQIIESLSLVKYEPTMTSVNMIELAEIPVGT
ncbi:hypothetical protein [Natronoglycomyces albus]|uniref:Uncharacterized protein n=1 Tax=Natronoglycomyces albus TaxID=2811108 RepID=A0A895XRY7_9ACTN|nr:hypothetical protein [Natronoglycomyces albus]QSB04388.1 hypothetical protein JQS30_11360 [Natronoglycomyces albus]